MERDDDDALAEISRRQSREQENYQRDQPATAGEAVASSLERIARAADMLDQVTSPVERKRRLANLIRSRVRCNPGMHHVEAERAAEYVVYDGLPLEVILRLLDELDDAERKGKLRGDRGRWFVGVLKLRLQDHGIQQRKKKPT
jgi:hypothetical protein